MNSANDIVIVGILLINLAATLVYLWIITNENRKLTFYNAPVIIQKMFVVLFVTPLFLTPIIAKSKFELNFTINIIGGMIVLAGLLLIIMAFFKIGIIPSIREKSSLSTLGAYKIVRHPIYGGTVITLLGLILLNGAIIPTFYFPISVSLYYIMTIFEEKSLVKEYGDEYLEYRKKIKKRLIPFIL